MSDRSRGPEGSHPPAPTDREASGGDDFYAAAAASAAGRSKSAGAASKGAGSSSGGAAKPKQSPSRSSGSNGSSASSPKSAGQGAGNRRTAGPANQPKPNKAADAGNAGQQGAAAGTGAVAGSATAVADKVETPEGEAEATSKLDIATAEPTEDKAAKKNEAKQAKADKAEKPKAGAAKGTRKARLRLSRVDPWSVMKTSFMFSIAAGIVLVVAVYAVWLVVGSSGLFESIDSIVGSVLQSPGDTTPFRIGDYVNTQKVMGVAAFLACIDVVIFTALATLASFLYNLAATMLGGLEVTLAED